MFITWFPHECADVQKRGCVVIFTHCGGCSLVYFFTEIRKAFTVRVQQNSSAWDSLVKRLPNKSPPLMFHTAIKRHVERPCPCCPLWLSINDNHTALQKKKKKKKKYRHASRPAAQKTLIAHKDVLADSRRCFIKGKHFVSELQRL